MIPRRHPNWYRRPAPPFVGVPSTPEDKTFEFDKPANVAMRARVEREVERARPATERIYNTKAHKAAHEEVEAWPDMPRPKLWDINERRWK